MVTWRPQPFQTEAQASKRDPKVIEAAISAANAIHEINPSLPPVFSLKHLSLLTTTDYDTLRKIVARKDANSYKIFRIRKRPAKNGKSRFRVIAVPQQTLLRVQSWITQNILAKAKPHNASVAFSKGDKLINAAAPHCGCRWLIKLDVQNFFESISEKSAYRVFRSLGYQALVAFEMTRLCTRIGGPSRLKDTNHWKIRPNHWIKIPFYNVVSRSAPQIGHLPQGAPTSPMLSNLAVKSFDRQVELISNKYGLVYTRYADDIALSTKSKDFSRLTAKKVIQEIGLAMRAVGLSPNLTKTNVVPPGARKIVLGLLVNMECPRLTREFKSNLRRHIYYISSSGVGPVKHSRARGFTSVSGFKNHLEGLVNFAIQIEPGYGRKCARDFAEVDWPL